MVRVFKRLRKEASIGARFALVGIAATLVHIAVVFGILTFIQISPIVANFCAFIVAFIVSFSGNYIWTFKAPGQAQRAMQRYFVVSGCACLANSGLLLCILQVTSLEPQLAALIAACIIPALTFLGSRFWSFKATITDHE